MKLRKQLWYLNGLTLYTLKFISIYPVLVKSQTIRGTVQPTKQYQQLTELPETQHNLMNSIYFSN